MTEFKFPILPDESDKENSRIPLLEKSLSSKSKTLEEVIACEYGESIDKIQKLKECESSTQDCLRIHRINEELRSKMVDWMVEVLQIFECSQRTFFLSVRIMDLFFKREVTTLGVEELHVIGVVCMMIASKYEDIKPLSMNTIHYKIGHERLPKAYLINVEKRILKVIEYRVCVPTVIDFLEPLIEKGGEGEKKNAVLIAELAQLDPGLAWLRPSSLAQAIYLLTGPVVVGEISAPNHVIFIMQELKEFLGNYAYPYQASFVKHNTNLSIKGLAFDISSQMQEE